ncbi:hypothetical protein [Borrelia sp. P9F1]|nr:hypothetical protein [Borrelia sp. P9F1]WKC58245.1 hypothetical protein QYZ68_03650 [Borrelia sp. P9F1]
MPAWVRIPPSPVESLVGGVVVAIFRGLVFVLTGLACVISGVYFRDFG